jgi:hypothetical protein
VLLDRFRQLKRQRQVRDRLGRAHREGTGIYLQEWVAEDQQPRDTGAVVTELLAWCRQTMSGTRRPYGIDSFDLALAVDEGSEQPRSTRFTRVRPLELYVEGALDARLAEWMAGCGKRPVHVAAALFSWGDLADATLPARS